MKLNLPIIVFDYFQKMVEELEGEVAAYEDETGRLQTKLPLLSSTGSFSGYTASLITAVTKLMGYLKEVHYYCHSYT